MIDLIPENLQQIETHLLGLGWMHPGEGLTALASAGEGNMNRTLRASIHGEQDRSLILKQAVPHVARYPTIAAPVERGAIEAKFYQAVQTHASVAAMMPQLLGRDPANHLLCLEDLGGGRDCTYLYQESASQTFDTTDLCDWLGQLHGITPPPQIDNLAMRTLNHEHIFVLPLAQNNGIDLHAGLADLKNQCVHNKRLNAKAAELARLYRKPDTAAIQVLLHGDFYPGSFIEHSKGLSVIDPEFTFTGPPEFDLGVMLAHLVMAEQSVDITPYKPPFDYDKDLAHAFAGMEIIRRIFGVAQLPLVFERRDEVETKRRFIG
ncbi:MAG: phosphotransferase, partial [Proteobacteria bacterium]|nr:phosphotransferase [Pseudomonadota bacterium]